VIYKNKIKVMKRKILSDVFHGEEPNYKPQFDNEIDLKVAMFKGAIERGEVDHLNIDQSFKATRKRKADLIASCSSDRKLIFHEKCKNNENETRTNAA
jgi:hypothetical protein